MSVRGETPEKSNIFAEVGLPAQYLAKAEILVGIDDAIKRKKMTQAAAAAVLGLDQPRLAALLRGRLDLFSLDRLLSFMKKLGNSVGISSVLREHPHECWATNCSENSIAANNQKKQRLDPV